MGWLRSSPLRCVEDNVGHHRYSFQGLWDHAPKNTNSYLVDPASSHMLVSKIKPCMSKYKHLYTVKLRTAHYISNYLFDG